MSDFIGHYCGLALVRLRRPLDHYQQRYGDPSWGLRKLYLLMEKQHNRGQDGAGMAVVKLDMPPGAKFIRRVRSAKPNAIERIFDVAMRDIRKLSKSKRRNASPDTLKVACEFLGETYMGHLRYGTHSGRSIDQCHPYTRKSTTASRNLSIAGNFNMTNSRELFDRLVGYGLSPVGDSDTQVILERLGYALDCEHDYLVSTMGPGSFRGLEGRELAEEVARELDLQRVLRKASHDWDGGYTFVGLLGNGDSFAIRDPAGIRPGFFYMDDDVVAVASERAALVTVFDVDPDKVEPIKPGHALIMKRDGGIDHVPFTEPRPLRQCTFERIYFSRGSDRDIYRERKALGRNLAPRVYASLDEDLDHAVFSYIPNTAETSYVGLVEELNRIHRAHQAQKLWQRIEDGSIQPTDLDRLMNGLVRTEKVAHKDQRLRTFITHDEARRDLVAHVYDITRGSVGPKDTLVVLDDSIVRGTTLRESIITMLSRLDPRRIVVVSSAPPIMYPDCYGIDMSQLGRFIAFEAAVALLEERGESGLLEDVERRCRAQAGYSSDRVQNYVRELYDPFDLDDLSRKISELVRPKHIEWDGEIEVIYQSVRGLHDAMPEYTGDWYFTGEYPTPGGYAVLNRSYLNWREASEARAY